MARLFARVAAFVLGIFIFANAGAQTYTYTFYVGNTNATGCTISTPAGPVDHVKWRLQATVTAGVSPQFGSVTRADCNSGVFGSPSAVASTSAIGLNTGVGGADAIEVQLPISAMGPTPSPREVLAVVASSDSASDALIASLPAAKGEAKGIQQAPPTLIPSMSLGGVLLLGLALLAIGWYALRRYAHLLPLSLLLVAGTAWAVAIVIDGQVSDWATVTPSTDATGDVPQSGIDLLGLYTTTQASNGYLRVDVLDLQSPPVADPGNANLLEDGDTTITLTGSDAGNAPLTFQIVTSPTRGILGAITPIDATSASVQYTGNADEYGADSFTFRVDNGSQLSAPATVMVAIAPVNDAPSFTAADPPAVNEGSGAHAVPAWATFTPGPANESAQAVLEYVVSAVGNPALFASAPTIDTNGTLSYTLADQANGSSSFTVAVRDDGGTTNGGIDLSSSQNFTLTVDAVNDAPSFVGGADVSALEDAGAQVVSGWATAIDDGDPEQSQALSFTVSANTNPALFSTAPAVDAVSGDLTYTAAPDANGTAQITLVLSDDGGTANGGSDTSASFVFNVQITAVNDAPSFTAVDPPAVNENSGAQTVPNWASFDPGPADESGQAVLQYTVSAIGNPALFAVAPSVAANGTLSYTTAPNASGSSNFTVAVQDDGGTANGGVDLSAGQSFTVTVNSVNSAPTFVGGGDVSVPEDAGAQTVTGWATAIDDGDPEVQALSFAFTANSNPALFSTAPAVDASSGNLTFTPAANASGSATLTLQLSDDGGTANGGNDTSAPYNFTLTVTPVNDAPTATPKSHTTHSAIELEIVAASHTGELLEGAADVDDPVGELTAQLVAGSATPAGAVVTITNASDGSFRYDPPGGSSGAGSFQFQICDDGAPQQCSAATTVSFTITGPDLYFVDDNAAPGGDGGLNDPFDAFSDLPPGRGNNDRIFAFAGNYPSAVHSFFVGEHLVGQGATGSFDALLGVVPVANGTLDARPIVTGSVGDRPAMNRIVMAGASDATMRGVALSTATGDAVFINGTTGITIADASAASSISGVIINNSSASAEGVTFSNVTSTGGVNGLVLTNVTGSFDFGAGSLTGNTGVSFLATGTLGSTSYAGNITKSSNGNLIEITGAAAGSVTLSGDLACTSSCDGIDVLNRGAGTITFSGASKIFTTSASTAVNLDNNDAATVDFTGGGLVIDAGSAGGLRAVAGGRVSVRGSGNSITNTGAAALEVDATQIGTALVAPESGLRFERISSNGGVSGIVLNATGADGGLTVTGSGGTCTSAATCSGGSVIGKSGSGVALTSTRDVTLNHLFVDNNDGSGILGTELTNFHFIAGRVTNNGDAVDGSEANLRFGRLMGTCSLDASVVSGSSQDELRFTPDAGVLTSFAITDTQFGPSAGTTGNGITVIASGAANVSVSVEGGVFTQLAGSGISANGTDTSHRTISVTQSQFHDNSNGVNLLGGADADLTYTVTDSSFLRHGINPIQVLSSSTSTNASQWVGEISGVTIGDGTPDSGSENLHGIAIEMNGDADSIQTIEGNDVRNTDIDAIFVQTRLDNDADAQIGRHDFALVDNTSGTPDDNSPFPFMIAYGNRIESRNTTAVCLDMSGNSAGSVGGLEHFRLRQRDTSSFGLERLSDGDGTPNELINSTAAVEAHMLAQNDAGNTADATLAIGFTETTDNACRTP